MHAWKRVGCRECQGHVGVLGVQGEPLQSTNSSLPCSVMATVERLRQSDGAIVGKTERRGRVREEGLTGSVAVVVVRLGEDGGRRNSSEKESDGGEEDDGAGALVLLCPVREFEEEDEVEAVPCVLLVRSEMLHAVLSTTAPHSAPPLRFRKTEREERGWRRKGGRWMGI